MNARAQNGGVDEPDPAARARRRSFTAEYKARVLAEYDALPVHSGERGALVRREGLYSSHIAEWRKARDAAGFDALEPKARPARRSTEQVQLEKANAKMRELVAEARTIVIVSHALALMQELCDSAAWLHKGELIQTGAPGDVVEAYMKFLKVGESAITLEDV